MSYSTWVYYFAATYDRNAEMRGYRDELVAAMPGCSVSSRWIDQHGGTALEAVTAARLNSHPAECWKYGLADIEDMSKAGTVALFTGDGPSARGGRHTEFGMALNELDAHNTSRLVIVGPRENVFHCHPDVEAYPTWQSFLSAEVQQWKR